MPQLDVLVISMIVANNVVRWVYVDNGTYLIGYKTIMHTNYVAMKFMIDKKESK